MTLAGARSTAVWALLLAVVLTACTPTDDGTDPAPSLPAADPTPTASQDATASERPSVAVVLPSRNARPIEEIDRHRELVAAIAADAVGRGAVSEVRTVVPDRFSTVGDVVELLAEEGAHDLVCALGPGAAGAVRAAAPRHPDVKFCGAPGRLPEVVGNALVFDVRVEETAYLAGIAARFAAEQVFGNEPGFPALIVGDRNQAVRLVPGFEAGFLSVGQAPGSTPLLVATDDPQAEAAVASQAEAGAFFVFASAGRAEAAIARAARDIGLLVAGSDAWLRDLVSTQPSEPSDGDGAVASSTPAASPAPTASPSGPRWDLLRFGEDLTAALRDAIDELETGWRGGSRSLGFANGALTVEAGTSPLWPLVAPQVLGARDAIVAEDIVVPAS